MDRPTFPTLPQGPWSSEPDREEFKHAGLDCLLNRSAAGAWCGYAAVPPGHPLHGKDYSEVNVKIHGGLTFSSECEGAICHVPASGEPDNVWWFGFDCGHTCDVTPILMAYYKQKHATYRTIDYVRNETKKLAEQLSNGEYVCVTGRNQDGMNNASCILRKDNDGA